MATLYQRKSDGRWIARVRSNGRTVHVTGSVREDVVRRVQAVQQDSPFELPPEPGFWPRVIKGPNCWLWNGGRSRDGYGKFHHQGTHQQAHRVAYELMVGPIPDGLTIDHLCRNPWCVNPAHMEPVTAAENTRRAHCTKVPA